ncbi:hypothetical protein S83_015203 [Arachis hypogaea]
MQGVISEEKVDSFNVPLIYPSVKAVKEILRGCDECFSIEWMEILEFKNMVSLPTVQIFVSWFRAALQGMIEKHFGAEIVDELFERFAEKVKEFPDIMDTDRLKLDVLFVLLRRKNKARPYAVLFNVNIISSVASSFLKACFLAGMTLLFYNHESPSILKLSLRLQVLSLCCAGSKAINDPKASCQRKLYSSSMQLLREITAKKLDILVNKASNILFVDQPIGTGFSYTSDDDDNHHDEAGVSNDLYDFLQAFFKEHPLFVKNDFYITGESYAGHYIPALASRVHQGNKANEGIIINRKGFAIGTDGGDACMTSLYKCNAIFSRIMSITSNSNYYDIRKKCEGNLCYDFSNVETFLNEKTVRDALGVRNLDFVSCSSTVYDAMMQDWMRNIEVGIPALLEDGIQVLVYAGEEDLICNWLGKLCAANSINLKLKLALCRFLIQIQMQCLR